MLCLLALVRQRRCIPPLRLRCMSCKNCSLHALHTHKHTHTHFGRRYNCSSRRSMERKEMSARPKKRKNIKTDKTTNNPKIQTQTQRTLKTSRRQRARRSHKDASAPAQARRRHKKRRNMPRENSRPATLPPAPRTWHARVARTTFT